MKELSIEQKAKAYDEAIKRIQSYVVDEYGCTRIKVVNVFPELKESEDEKIRKEIIRIVDGYFPDKTSIQRGKYIAWLEKQDEKPKKVSIWKHWKDGIAGNGDDKLIYLVKNGDDYSLSSSLGYECDYIELSELNDL